MEDFSDDHDPAFSTAKPKKKLRNHSSNLLETADIVDPFSKKKMKKKNKK